MNITHNTPKQIAAFLAIIINCTPLIMHGTPLLYFDIANAPDNIYSIPPTYIENSDQFLSSTSLTAVGVTFAHDSDLGSHGDFIFDGWGVKEQPLDFSKYFEFSVTANQDLTLESLHYTFFGGLWSNRGGPRGVIVRASKDGFVNNISNIRNEGWNLFQTTPFTLNCPNDFTENISDIGDLVSGETISFRFYAVYTDYGDVPGGFWNKSSGDYNLTLGGSIPEPGAIGCLLGAFALLTVVAKRRQIANSQLA